MDSWLHQGIIGIHIAGGMAALVSGTMAVAARKGGTLHALAGTGFFASMLVLGVTASILEPFRSPPGSPIGGILVCYFVATSWVAARRRDGTTGRFEIIACAVALGLAALIVWGGFAGTANTPAGRGPIFALAGICLLAGLLDLNAILRAKLTAVQRISRHLWRMCFAFFIATGSFFLGQQDVLPEAVRGSPVLFLLAFAPFAVMAVLARPGSARKEVSRCVSRAAGRVGSRRDLRVSDFPGFPNCRKVTCHSKPRGAGDTTVEPLAFTSRTSSARSATPSRPKRKAPSTPAKPVRIAQRPRREAAADRPVRGDPDARAARHRSRGSPAGRDRGIVAGTVAGPERAVIGVRRRREPGAAQRRHWRRYWLSVAQRSVPSRRGCGERLADDRHRRQRDPRARRRSAPRRTGPGR